LPINFKPFFHHQPGRSSIIVVHSWVGRREGGEDGLVEGEVITQAVQEVTTGQGGVMLNIVMAKYIKPILMRIQKELERKGRDEQDVQSDILQRERSSPWTRK
jgi:hypothetical protein